MPGIAARIERWPIDRLIFYARNPRKNDAVVDRSIREFGSGRTTNSGTTIHNNSSVRRPTSRFRTLSAPRAGGRAQNRSCHESGGPPGRSEKTPAGEGGKQKTRQTESSDQEVPKRGAEALASHS